MRTWHLITGEYPPQPGGVSDYSFLVAHALAANGDNVRVWAPECGQDTRTGAPGTDKSTEWPKVSRLPGRFGVKALAVLGRELKRTPGQVIVQYVPHAFGYNAMNLAFSAWLFAHGKSGAWTPPG